MRLAWLVKWDLSRNLLGFYRMDDVGIVKNCWLYMGNIGIFVWWVMLWELWKIWIAERYRLIRWIYWDWKRLVRDFLAILGAIFERVRWEIVGKDWDFTIRWSIRWEMNGECELVGIYCEEGFSSQCGDWPAYAAEPIQDLRQDGKYPHPLFFMSSNRY